MTAPIASGGSDVAGWGLHPLESAALSRRTPHCGAFNQSGPLKGKSTRPGVYKCNACAKPFSVTVGTVIERSHIPLSKWVLASRLLASSKKSMSAHQLEADSSVPKSSDPSISS